MDEKIVVAVIAGTKRQGRESIKAARYVETFARQLPNVEVLFVDPADVDLPPDGAPEDGRNATYSDITARADAFFIVAPEYNHGYPGSLKRLLDSEYENYFRKPVAVAGVSNGQWGGVRVVEAMWPVVRSLHLVAVRNELYFPRVHDLFDENGSIKPEYREQYDGSTQKVFDDLLWFARTLKSGRNQATPLS